MSDVRAMLACLANEETARVFASVVLGDRAASATPAARRQKAEALLVRSGLIAEDGRGGVELNLAEIRRTLSEIGNESSTGESRWLDRDGRISRYPRRPAERARFLADLGKDILRVEERVSEAQLNERLAPLTDDVPTLRRYLVVHGVLGRTPDGSLYWRQ